MHWEILDSARKKLLPKLSCVRDFGFYLAGGTALALQLGHRRSTDFDFYSLQDFDAMQLENQLVQGLTAFKVTQRGHGTLLGQTGRVEITFFHYPYPLLEDLVEADPLRLASITDIAAMKMIALSQRGLRRDFLDLYVIAKRSGLEQIFLWTGKKYKQFDPHLALKSLAYFKDADEDDSGRGMELNQKISWSAMKRFFEKEAIRLSKRWL